MYLVKKVVTVVSVPCGCLFDIVVIMPCLGKIIVFNLTLSIPLYLSHILLYPNVPIG